MLCLAGDMFVVGIFVNQFNWNQCKHQNQCELRLYFYYISMALILCGMTKWLMTNDLII